MDVDKLFKLPKVPQASLNKRKWSEPTKETLQSFQHQDGAASAGKESLSAPPLRAPKAARVSQGDSDSGEEEDFAPGNDADYFVDEDDDGGRFFGGGLTSQQKRILEIMNSSNEADDDGNESGPKAEEQVKSFRRSLVRLERAINKNQEMRVRFSDDPSKYVAAIRYTCLNGTDTMQMLPLQIYRIRSRSRHCHQSSSDCDDQSTTLLPRHDQAWLQCIPLQLVQS